MADEGQSLTVTRFGQRFCVTCTDGIALVGLLESQVRKLETKVGKLRVAKIALEAEIANRERAYEKTHAYGQYQFEERLEAEARVTEQAPRPMSEAPTDGTPILVVKRSQFSAKGYWIATPQEGWIPLTEQNKGIHIG